MQRLFGASSSFYGGTSYGSAVPGAPAMVREFVVQAETSRSYIIGHDLKVNKKSMQLKLSSFTVDMFDSVEAAIKSLQIKN